jgi:hypothetical protein
MWVEVSRLIASKFKKSKKSKQSKTLKLTNQSELRKLFIPQYGCYLHLSEIQLKKRFYIIEVSDYLDRRYVIKWIPAIKDGSFFVYFDPLYNLYSISFRQNNKWPPKFYFVIDLTTFNFTFRKTDDVFLDEIDNYSELFGTFTCNFASSKPFPNQEISLNKQYGVNITKIMNWVENCQVTSIDGKWYKFNLSQGLLRGHLHIYHFRNLPNLWFITTKLLDNDKCELFLFHLNENNEMVKLHELTYHTHLVCPIYCPWSKAVFILSNFKNGVTKFYQFHSF